MLAFLLLLCLALERVESNVPEGLEKVLDLDETFGTRPIQASSAVASLAHEPRLLQDAQMLGDRGARHVELGGDLAGAELLVTDEGQDRSPPRFGDRFQCGLHSTIFNHSLT